MGTTPNSQMIFELTTTGPLLYHCDSEEQQRSFGPRAGSSSGSSTNRLANVAGAYRFPDEALLWTRQNPNRPKFIRRRRPLGYDRPRASFNRSHIYVCRDLN